MVVQINTLALCFKTSFLVVLITAIIDGVSLV